MSLSKSDSVTKAKRMRGTSPKKKTIKEPKDKKEEKVTILESPTSVSMKNSFIIKNHDANFDIYYN